MKNTQSFYRYAEFSRVSLSFKITIDVSFLKTHMAFFFSKDVCPETLAIPLRENHNHEVDLAYGQELIAREVSRKHVKARLREDDTVDPNEVWRRFQCEVARLGEPYSKVSR